MQFESGIRRVADNNLPNARWCSSCHEAGHALARWWVDETTEIELSVTQGSDEGEYGGLTRYMRVQSNRFGDYDQAVAHLAGPIAEALIARTRGGLELDVEMFAEETRGWPPAFVEHVKGQAFNLVIRLRSWIEKLARRLCDASHLDQEDFKSFIDENEDLVSLRRTHMG